jgi:hypothetical protein
MILFTVLDDSLNGPIVVICSAHLMGVTVFQRPADANDEDRWGVLQKNLSLTLFSG